MPTSQGALAQQPGVPPPPPLNRPLPPLTTRTAPKAQAAPNWTLRRPQSLKRDQPHQGHPVAINVPFKMPNVAPTSTRIFPRHIEHLSEEQGPPRRVQLPVDVNPDMTTFEYLGLKLGKSFLPPKQYRTRREGVKTNNTDQAPVLQLPIGQALGTSKLRSSANGGMSAVAPEQLRGPDPFRSNASGSTSAVLPEQPRGSEPRREPEPSNEVRSSKSEAERKQEEHLAMIKRMEQEILDEEEEAEREAEAMNDVPTAPVPRNEPLRKVQLPTDVNPDITTHEYLQRMIKMRMLAFVGDPAIYSLRKLIQKVLVVAGKEEFEDAEFDEAALDAVTAREFMELFTTFLEL
ncbi:unnamed protein product [Caenorhabditis brenneri]